MLLNVRLGHSLRFHNMFAARGMPRTRLIRDMAERAAVWWRKSSAKECSAAVAPPVVSFSKGILLIWPPSISD